MKGKWFLIFYLYHAGKGVTKQFKIELKSQNEEDAIKEASREYEERKDLVFSDRFVSPEVHYIVPLDSK